MAATLRTTLNKTAFSGPIKLLFVSIILSFFTDTNAPDLFQIEESTGLITVKTQIDREELLHIDASVVLSVKVSLLTTEFDGILLL